MATAKRAHGVTALVPMEDQIVHSQLTVVLGKEMGKAVTSVRRVNPIIATAMTVRMWM